VIVAYTTYAVETTVTLYCIDMTELHIVQGVLDSILKTPVYISSV